MLKYLIAATLFAAPAALAADAASGIIQICRVATAGDHHEGRAIEIPPGASFGDTGNGSDHRGNYWPLWIATVGSMRLAADEQCGAVSAQITGNTEKRPLRIVDHRWFTPTSGDNARLPGWPGNLSLAATVTSDFRSPARSR